MEAVRIRGIAAGGDGVGSLGDGRAAFIPRTAPGDLVEPRDVVMAKRFARARVGRLLEASPDRVAPRCTHYEGDGCGGCQLQHLAPAAQREARRAIVAEALRRIGHVEVEVPAVVPATADWEYRTKITLTVKRGRIGYHRVGAPGEVFDLARCEIARPELNRLWGAVTAARRHLPAAATKVVLRVDRAGGRHVLVEDDGERAWSAGSFGRALRAAGETAVVWWAPSDGVARAVHGSRTAYPATVFEQIHPAMGDRVRAHAVALLGDIAGRHAWDLYAGIGETTALLVAAGATVESVERDRHAVALAEQRADPRVVRHQGRVEELLPRLRPADAAIMNPPRTGLGEEVTATLSARPPVRLLYISCDPATLARDIARLTSRYRVTAVQPFDLFPQTAHVETVVRLEQQ